MRDPAMQSFFDITLWVQGQKFPSHKAVLCGASDMLRSLLAKSWRECDANNVELKAVSPTAFGHILDYIYTGDLNIAVSDKHVPDNQRLLEIDSAARYLLMPTSLVSRLRTLILRSITTDNVLSVGEHAYRMGDEGLESECERFACEHFQDILDGSQFLDLPYTCLKHFVASSDLVLREGEVSLLHRLSLWVAHDSASRARYFHKLLHNVRFSDMALEELAAIAKAAGPASEIASRASQAIAELELSGLSVTAQADPSDEKNGNVIPSVVPVLLRKHSRGVDNRRGDGQDNAGPRFRAQRRCIRNIRFDFVVRDVGRAGHPVQALNSPWYKCGGGLLWRLELYPRGSSPELQDYMSVFLRCCNGSDLDEFECSASFSLFLVEQNFGAQEQVFGATKAFTSKEPCWGRAKYVLRSALLAENGYRDSRGNVVIGVSVTF
jgi:BTB/POZ domain